MKISEIDISILNKVLRKNLGEFAEETTKMLQSNSKNSFRLLLDDLCHDKIVYDLDIEKAKRKIFKIIENKSNAQYQTRKVIDNQFWENDIYFNIEHIEPDWGSQADNTNRINRRILEYKCEEEFWSNKNYAAGYKKVKSNFTPYLDFECLEEEIEKIKFQDFKRNHENWIDFLKSIIEQLFSEYEYSKKLSNGVIRYLKELKDTDGLYFGFEFDQKRLSTIVNKDAFALPEYFNLILCVKDFKLKSQSKKYLLQSHPDVLSLGIMGNPFCFPPCFSVKNFSSIDFFFTYDKPDNNIDLNYERKYLRQSNGNYKVEHPHVHGEKMKMHAYFYMVALSISVKPYLAYLENSIIETIKNNA
ncbi:hypothetical protein GYB29_07380 [bacterium]|nr:hypothetical protein [bacterium]